ncbi:MAG: M24 family metallopeptidase [Betaproteobacteria bacterium]|nr:M24 family metallopeptidase [Betaproteobacteria bacterium]
MAQDETRLCDAVPATELERRWAAVRALMRDEGLEALVLQNANDWLGGYVRWFTGAPANNAYPRSLIFPAHGQMTSVGQGPFGGVNEFDGRDPLAYGVGRQLFTPSYVSAAYTADYDADLVLAELRRAGWRTIGLVAPASMYHGFARRLDEGLSAEGVHSVDATEWIDALKAIKSDEEQSRLRRTAAMQDAVFAKVCEFVRPGLKDFEVAAYAQYVGQQLGSEQGIFIGSSAPAGQPAMFRPRSQQGRELRAGDTLTLLIENNGAGGYYTELSRPIVLGKAAQEEKDLWAFVLEAQQATLDLLRPGASCRAIFEQYNAFLRARGRPEEKRLHCHGQGYDMVERPLIRHDESMSIAAGMCIVVHPAVKTERAFMTVVDNYLIGADGPGECLHRTPKTLIELG